MFIQKMRSLLQLSLQIDRLPSLVIALATRSCEVPILSRVRLWILETWTPISRWMPEHSMQTITPKLVDIHVTSENHKMSLIKKA